MTSKNRTRFMPDRFRRVWAVAQHIADRPGQSRRELADLFFLSERQVQADLAVLRSEMQMPLVRQRGYRFVDETGAPGGHGLNIRDVIVLAQGLEAGARSRLVNAERLRQASEKVALFAPLHLQPLARQLLVGPQRSLFLALVDAILAERRPFVQVSLGSGPITLRPELLLPHLGQWFVLGIDASERDRMVNMELVTAVTLAEAAPEPTARIGRAS